MVQGRRVLRPFKTGRWLGIGAIGLSIGFGFLPPAFAQGGQTEISKTTPAPPPPAPPAVSAPVAPPPAPTQKAASPAAPAANWQTNVAQPPAPAQEPEAQVVAKINDYFNKLTELQGTFVQTDPDNRVKRGRFYFERPGKVRFDYAAPSGLKIISDGRYLAIEDHDMNTSEKYPLDVTPFRLLLAETVDLANDARMVGVEQGADAIILTVEDKKGDGSGRIRLFFNAPDINLKQWIITDAQGLDTRIELADLEQNKKVAANFFHFSAMLGIDHDR
jgi:outer membrane lipoprotein-sorting protein